MKLFGVILLAGYFLAHENEHPARRRNLTFGLIRDWAIYVACAGSPFFFGALVNGSENNFYIFALLLAAALPVILFQGRVVCMLAGAATAFCALRLMPDFIKAATILLIAEGAVLVGAFFYASVRQRMLRLQFPERAERSVGRMLLLFALAVFFSVIFKKMVG